MKKHVAIILLLTLVITNSSIGQNINKFSLNGKTRNIPNGTILLLQNPLLNKFIDSIKVIENSFVLNTELNDLPVKLILWKNGATAKVFWAENNKMTFDSSNSSFKNAVIKNSFTDSLATSLRNNYKKLESYEEIVSYELEFIKNNPNSILSAHNLSIMAKVFGKEKSTNLFNKFSTQNKQSNYGKIISEFLKLNITKTPQIGERYVDFNMNNQNGKLKKLSELDGKYILLEFWASWCLPCRKENPELVRIYNKFKSSDFEIFAVSLDNNKENWIRAIKKDNLNWKHVSDLKGGNNIASIIYAVNEIPDNILIDKNGVIIARDLRSDKLDKLLSELLLEKGYSIKKGKNSTTLRLNKVIIWKDEKGNVLTKLEVEKMLKTKKYIPNLNTEKKIMVLEKI